MIYDNDNNPYDMNLLTEISDHFHNVRQNYTEYEGSMRGVDINMLVNQVPGGMLSILEKQLADLDRKDKLKALIDEIPNIRKDVGYVPLVTPSSQILGAQALMNVLDEKRYKTLTKEFVDLVNGKYGEIPGTICPKLLKKVEKNTDSTEENAQISIKSFKEEFKKFCLDNKINDYSKSETDLLNYILFKNEAKDYYLAKSSNKSDDIISLQEGFGLYHIID